MSSKVINKYLMMLSRGVIISVLLLLASLILSVLLMGPVVLMSHYEDFRFLAFYILYAVVITYIEECA